MKLGDILTSKCGECGLPIKWSELVYIPHRRKSGTVHKDCLAPYITTEGETMKHNSLSHLGKKPAGLAKAGTTLSPGPAKKITPRNNPRMSSKATNNKRLVPVA